MSMEINGELVLDENETVALIRNMLHPNADAIRCRDLFLRDRDDMNFCLSDDGIIAECSINLLENKQQIYNTQLIMSNLGSDLSYKQQSVEFDYSEDKNNHFVFSSSKTKKDNSWCNNPRVTDSSIAKAA